MTSTLITGKGIVNPIKASLYKQILLALKEDSLNCIIDPVYCSVRYIVVLLYLYYLAIPINIKPKVPPNTYCSS